MAPTQRSALNAFQFSALVGFIIGCFLLFFFFMGGSFLGLDLVRTNLGWICALQENLRDHYGLAVSSTLGNGAPLWADPQSLAAYPLRWLVLFLPAWCAIQVEVILHFSIAGAGTVFLGQTFGLSRRNSILLGLSFVGGGTFLDLLRHGPYLFSASWIPWAWALGTQAFHSPGIKDQRGYKVAYAFCLLMILLSGDPQSYLIGISLPFLRFFFKEKAKCVSVKSIAVFCLISIATLLLTWVQWGPSLAEMKGSGRDLIGFISRSDQIWFFDRWNALGSLVSGLLPDQSFPGSGLRQLVPGLSPEVGWNANPYLGWILWSLIFCAIIFEADLLLKRKRPTPNSTPPVQEELNWHHWTQVVFPLVTITVVFLFMSLGAYGFILPLLRSWIPILSQFRYPMKWFLGTYLGGLTLGYLLAEELGRVSQDKTVHSSSLNRFLLLLLGIGTLTFVVAMASCVIYGLNWDHSALQLLGDHSASADALTQQGGFSSIVAQRFGYSATVLVIATGVLLKRPRWFPFLIALDVVIAGSLGLNFVFDRELASRVPKKIPKNSFVSGPICSDPFFELIRKEWPDGKSHPENEQKEFFSTHLPLVNSCFGISDGQSYSPIHPSPLFDWVEQKFRIGDLHAARALGCQSVLTLRDLSNPNQLVLGQNPQIKEISVSDPLPAAYILDRPKMVKLGSLEPLQAQEISTLDLTHWVESDIDISKVFAGGQLGQSVHLQQNRPDTIDLDLTGSGPAIIGVRRAFAKGWEATQAGFPLTVLRASAFQIGVLVPHLENGPVKLTYRIPERRNALYLSLFGFLLLMGTCAPIFLPKRK